MEPPPLFLICNSDRIIMTYLLFEKIERFFERIKNEKSGTLALASDFVDDSLIHFPAQIFCLLREMLYFELRSRQAVP